MFMKHLRNMTMFVFFICFAVLFHEKILGFIDYMKMLLNDDLCKTIPQNLSKSLFKISNKFDFYTNN